MTTIAPNDTNVVYSPYNWLVGSGSSKTICSGAYHRTTIAGAPTTLAATFDVTNQPAIKSRVGFMVDGILWQEADVAASVSITLPTSVTAAVHTIEMVVLATTETSQRWNSPQGTAVVFTGYVGDTTITTRTTRRADDNYLFIGDSITEGVRTLNMTATNDTNRNDSRVSWAYPLRSLLGAEIGVVGFGGVGIAKSGSGSVPKFSDSVPYLWSGQARDITTPKTPKMIICHIGTNDGASTDEDVATYTTALLNPLLAATTCPILVLPGWLGRKATAIQTGISAVTTPSRVTFVSTTGWWSTADASDALHPYGYVNTSDLAPRLASLIKTAQSPNGKRYIYSGGMWVLVA